MPSKLLQTKETKLRRCLGSCGRDFLSEGPHNRFCRRCLERQREVCSALEEKALEFARFRARDRTS